MHHHRCNEAQILNSLSMAVFVVDSHNVIRYLNTAAESLFNTKPLRLNQPLAADLRLSEGEGLTKKPLLDLIQRTRRDSKNYAYRQAILHLPDKQSHSIDCCLSSLSDQDNETVLVEITVADHLFQITRDSQRLDQSLAAHEIAKNLAHEINNPLSGIQGAAQLLEKTLKDREQTECTQIIIHETKRLQKLIRHMLGPSQLPQYEKMNIHDILEHVKFLGGSECSRTINIQRDYDPSIPLITADRDQLIQAVLNLLRNAIQALNGKGTITLRTRSARNITIGKTLHKLALKVDIADNGPGIPQPLQEHIFLPMIKGDDQRQAAQGSGLGLSIAQSLIHQNKGYITCSSTAGDTVFSIYLPIQSSLST